MAKEFIFLDEDQKQCVREVIENTDLKIFFTDELSRRKFIECLLGGWKDTEATRPIDPETGTKETYTEYGVDCPPEKGKCDPCGCDETDEEVVDPAIQVEAADYSETTPVDTALAGDATTDSVAGGTNPVYAVASGPQNGTLVMDPTGTYTYTPNAGYEGPDSFSYTITNDEAQTDTGIVNITVEAA